MATRKTQPRRKKGEAYHCPRCGREADFYQSQKANAAGQYPIIADHKRQGAPGLNNRLLSESYRRRLVAALGETCTLAPLEDKADAI